jgi:G3E family GTPase
VQDTRLVLVTGLDRGATGWVAGRLLHAEPGTVLVQHDLGGLTEGVVHRTVRPTDGPPTETVLELAHGCLSCTLRLDTLPLLRALAAKPEVRRIVLHLDPGVEPEPVCWALHNVLVGTVTVAEVATGDEPIGLTPDDDRTLAQVAVGQVEFADAIVVTGQAADGWAAARTAAVLDRLAPAAPRASSAHHLLDAIPADARRGEVADAHAPLLRWSPPLEPDCGVTLTVFEARRPFHPGRLHDAIDVLLEGVVRTRGRIWVATQPDVALWLESAGGGLRVGHAGAWLAAVDDTTWQRASGDRRAKAAVDWHPRWGDRMQEIAILSHDAAPAHLVATLREALLTDDELAADWDCYEDPFTAREPLEDKA